MRAVRGAYRRAFRFSEIPVKLPPAGEILFRGHSVFAYQRVHVIAGHAGDVARLFFRPVDAQFSVVRAVHETEIGAAAEHVKIHVRAHLQRVAVSFGAGSGFPVVKFILPVHAASAPVFANQGRLVPLPGLQGADGGLAFDAVIHRAPYGFIARAVGIHDGIVPVRRVKRHVDPHLPHQGCRPAQVFPVVPVASVLVFHRDSDDRPAAGGKEGNEFPRQAFRIAAHSLHKAFIACSQGDPRGFEQP